MKKTWWALRKRGTAVDFFVETDEDGTMKMPVSHTPWPDGHILLTTYENAALEVDEFEGKGSYEGRPRNRHQ